MSPGWWLQFIISRHKSNTLAREIDQVLREARSEPLSAAQLDSVLEVIGIPDSMRAHQVHAPVIRPLFGSPQNRSMVGVAGRPVQQVGKELVHILGGAEIGGRLNGRKTPKPH